MILYPSLRNGRVPSASTLFSIYNRKRFWTAAPGRVPDILSAASHQPAALCNQVRMYYSPSTHLLISLRNIIAKTAGIVKREIWLGISAASYHQRGYFDVIREPILSLLEQSHLHTHTAPAPFGTILFSHTTLQHSEKASAFPVPAQYRPHTQAG